MPAFLERMMGLAPHTVHQETGRYMSIPFQTILLSGGTGSLGQALTRFLLSLSSTVAIRILSRGEHRQADMDTALQSDQVRYLIGDVRDYERVLLACHGVDLVIHAAALKRQPTLEYNPYEGVQTNVLGTYNVLRACAEAGVARCITVSSDKAVLPVTLYGHTKAIAESLAIRANMYRPGSFRSCVVRWGNVAGSQGSVIRIWQEALRRGELLTITDATATRFWVAMQEAVDAVWDAAQQETAGVLYVPHSPAFMVQDLAVAMIRREFKLHSMHAEIALSVHTKDIGRRPAEKLHEVLLTDDEQARAVWSAGGACYLVPPVVRSWQETVDLGTFPAATFATAYRSDVWPYRLTTEMLAHRLDGLL